MIELDDRHIYRVDGKVVPGFSEIIKDLGIGGNPFYTDERREEGKALHRWILFLASGKEPVKIADERIAGRVEGFKLFLKQTHFKFLFGEEPLHDYLYNFCTTPDLVGIINKEACLVECKSGAREPWHRLQTAAQKQALESNKHFIKNRFALYLKEDNYSLEKHVDGSDETRWRTLVGAYHSKRFYL